MIIISSIYHMELTNLVILQCENYLLMARYIPGLIDFG